MAIEDQIWKAELTCTTGTSNKFYNVTVTQGEAWYNLYAHWGRIGTKGQIKIIGNKFSKEYALTQARILVRKKQSKGYLLQGQTMLPKQIEIDVKEKIIAPKKKKSKLTSMKRFQNIDI